MSLLAPPISSLSTVLTKILLLGLECQDLLFDRALRDEPIGGDDLGLSDAVRAVSGLVPPQRGSTTDQSEMTVVGRR